MYKKTQFFQSLSLNESLMEHQTKTLAEIIDSFYSEQNFSCDQIKNITIITPKHTVFVAHLLYKSLVENGFKIQIQTTLPEKFDDNLHIMICPQIFDRMPKHYIAFQMEQLESSQWFNKSYRIILQNSIAIFDYSIQNIAYLQSHGFSQKCLFHLPIAPFNGYQKFLLDHGHWDGGETDTCAVLFYGDPNSERRQNYLRALQQRFSVKIINDVFGNDLYRELLSARVIVNIHYYENALLETTRIYECLSLGLNVLSEESSDMAAHSTLLDQVDFVRIGDINHMVERVEKILGKEEKVSVIIPCYNQAEFLDETVQSVLDQSYKNIEVIIVNDGSTDNSMELACRWSEKYPDKIRVIKQENKGLSEARNSGIREASGNYLFLLDADDKLHHTMIDKCMQAISVHDIDIVYADYQRFGETDTVQRTRDKVELYDLQYANVTGATALYKKDVWEKTGGYKQNMHGGYEDWEFWINATKNGFKFHHIPEVLFYYRVKKESMYTDAYAKHDYLYGKIVMNHPELYTNEQQCDAISSIKTFEDTPDLYFQILKDIAINEKEIITVVGNYLQNNNVNTIIQSEEAHIISSSDKFGSIALCSLKSIKNKNMIGEMFTELDVDHILFYTQLKYNITNIDILKSSDFAWSQKEGVVQAEGTSFSFDLQDNPILKIEAYKRSEKYIKDKYERLETTFRQNENYIKDLESKEQEIKRLKDELTLICTSKSWRYTSAIRLLKQKLFNK